jgi:hypothetical protein
LGGGGHVLAVSLPSTVERRASTNNDDSLQQQQHDLNDIPVPQ